MKHIGFLAVLFVVLLGAVIVKETSRPDAGSLRDQLPQQALGAKPWTVDDAARIVVQGPGKSDTFTLKKTDDGVWTVEDPFRAPAAAGVVDTFLTAVNEARGELRLDDTAALAKFDLNDDRATRVSVEDAAGLSLVEFALGKSSGQRGAFVRPLFDGVRDGAYAVSQDLRGALGLTRTQPGDTKLQNPQPSHFHDLALPPFSVGDAMRVDLMTPNWSVAFEKRGPAWMAAEGGPNAPMRGQSVDQLVRQYGGNTSATSLVDPATIADTGLDAPAYSARVAPLDGTPRVAFGSVASDKCYVRFETDSELQVIYELTRYAFDRLFPKGGTLFEFSPLDADGVVHLDVKRSGQGFTLSREDPSADWTIASPEWKLPPAATQLRSIGSVLRSVRATDWYAGAVPFSDEVIVTFSTQSAPDSHVSLRVGQEAPGGGGRLAILPGSDDVFVIASSAVERVAPDTLSLFEPQPLSGVSPDDLMFVAVHDIDPSDGSRTEQFRITASEEGGWHVLRGGEARPGNDVPIRMWLDHLLDVEVTTRSDYTGPFTREVEIARTNEDSVWIALGTGSEELGTAVRIGGVTFFADVDAAVGSVDPATLVRPQDETPPEENGGEETDE